jgi:hypothetical protein
MSLQRSNIALILIILITFSLACNLTGGGEDSAEISAENFIATSVAATLAAGGGDGADDPTQTINPTVTASPREPNFNYAGISFAFNQALAENIVAGVNPAVIDENAWWSTPEYREYIFNNWVLADSFLPAKIAIYPVADFRAINPGVGERLDSLLEVITNKPADGNGALVADVHNAGQMFKSNVSYLEFRNGEGIRYLTQYGQALSPIGWPMMFYTFQGFTDDGLYYVSAILPATHPALPRSETITMDQAFMDNWGTYVGDLQIELNGEPDNMFMPPLGLLDGMIESMTIGEQ